MKIRKVLFGILACLTACVCAFGGVGCDGDDAGDAGGSQSAASGAAGSSASSSGGEESPHTHVWDEGSVTTPASCSTTGVKTYTCACGETYTEELAKTAHSYSGGVCVHCTAPQTAGLLYTLNADGESYSVSGMEDCEDAEIVIPNTYNGKPVTAITGALGSSTSYYDGNTLRSVVISEGIKSIGAGAFRACSHLVSVTLPESLESIDSYAFSGCYKLIEICNKSELTLVEGEGVTKNGGIASYAEHIYTQEGDSRISRENGYILYTNGNTVRCLGYTGQDIVYEIPSGVTEIYKYAFYGDRDVYGVVIPETVTSIGTEAFRSCHTMVEVYNRSAALTISTDDDEGENGYVADYAEEVYTEPFVSRLSVEDGYVYYTCGETVYLMGYTGTEKDLTIPDKATGIYKYAFFRDATIESVTIGSNIKFINGYAFYECSNLSRVTMAEGGVENIYTYAFYETALTELELPDSMVEIKSYAFSGCPLTSVELGEGLTKIGKYAFYDCWKLGNVSFPASLTYIGTFAFEGCNSLASATFEEDGHWFLYEYACTVVGFATNKYSAAETALELRGNYASKEWKRIS